MKILSLFDGISCARVALERAGIPVEVYYASEIDKYAIQISKKNYPDIHHIGTVTELHGDNNRLWNEKAEPNGLFSHRTCSIDLLIGGSPCQDLSIAKRNRKGLDGERSGLFWEYVRILREVKPKYFILENVASMPKEAKELITKTLGVEPIMINASLVSAQQRKRLFWTNIPNVNLPEDKGILLKDILENGDSDRLKSYCIDANYAKGANWKQYIEKGRRQLVRIGSLNSGGQGDRIYSPEGKSVGLSALGGGRGAKTGLYAISKPIILGNEPLQVLKEGRTELGKQSRREIRKQTGKDSTFRSKGHKAYYGRDGVKANCITTGLGAEGMIVKDFQIRKLTPIECERLQGLPDNYTEGVSNTQRYKTLGNGFNVDVITHILSFIPKQ